VLIELMLSTPRKGRLMKRGKKKEREIWSIKIKLVSGKLPRKKVKKLFSKLLRERKLRKSQTPK
jgi:hypothetical protein